MAFRFRLGIPVIFILALISAGNSFAFDCDMCHPDAERVARSVHGRKDKHPGDHPVCTSCHVGYTDEHEPKEKFNISRQERVKMCSNCHSNSDRMKPYGVRVSAVSSYERSYHGKALLRFGKNNAADCTDCHGWHDIHSSSSKSASTYRTKVAVKCQKCHPGAKMNFAASGANHLELRMEEWPLLRFEELFFKALTMGVMCCLVGMIAIDLRRKVLCRDHKPESGRFVATLIALSFLSLVAGIIIACFGLQGAEWAWFTSTVLMIVAFSVYGFERRGVARTKTKAYYQRFDVNQRAQHILLVISFTVLVLTGMPLRFAHIGWTHHLNLLFGGFDGARVAHRVAAVMMIVAWCWHFVYLLGRWRKAGFTMKSWTMRPTWQDVTDLIHTIKYGLSMHSERPRYGRFNFREKFDYFAVFWGMPIMVISGFILWFPVLIGNWLPDFVHGAAFIAHSDEALLAMLAILVWHFYNVHFNPDNFPMNRVWLTGRLTETEMEREHAVEKALVDSDKE